MSASGSRILLLKNRSRSVPAHLREDPEALMLGSLGAGREIVVKTVFLV